MNYYINEFFKSYGIDDIKQPIHGELLEHSTKHCTYWYGNGELIIVPMHGNEVVYVVDRIGFNEILVAV